MANQTSESLAAGTVLAGRYRVERQLGRGGMGSVYLVQHLHTEQQLALKLLHATIVSDEVALTRFRREARAPARIGSDHVVQVTDADVAPELGGVPFLVMEWLRGRDLEELCAERGQVSGPETILFLRHAARALDKAHGLGIVHRDLKPENLFLTTREDGAPWVKILDFGIAKLTSGEGDGKLKATGTGQIFGTPLYMSPEQTKGETDRISPRSDIWALGIIAHRLLTGVEPWTASTLTALIAQIAYEPLPVPSQKGHDLGPGFDAWFARCCARDPDARFATAGEAVTALGRALGISEEAPSVSLRPSGPVAVVTPRVDSDHTAFSATAPALPTGPVSVAETQVSASAPPNRRTVVVGVAAGMVVVGLATAGILAMRSGPAPAHPLPAESSAPAASAPAATVTVTPGSAAPVVEPAPTASASARPPEPPTDARKPPRAPVAGPMPTPPTAKATASPTPPPAPAPPPTPDDPLRTRH